MCESVSSGLELYQIILPGVAFFHSSVEVDTIPIHKRLKLPVVWHPEEHTETKSQPHLSANVVIVERLVKPISVSEYGAAHLFFIT